MSYRVKPQSIDAGFGNMEKGNFVHDVLEHLHARLPQEGMERVTPMNLPRAKELLHEVFADTLAEHAGKRGTEGPLVPLSPVEERQVAEILPQLEGVLAYEAEALTPFAPRYLEFAFNDLKVEYAGWPLGGRIDRVDVDAENRAAVIDYKHRTGVRSLSSPTYGTRRGIGHGAHRRSALVAATYPNAHLRPGHAPGAEFGHPRGALLFDQGRQASVARCRERRAA